jgi:hypothetical protein|tara:strand:- start:138 stop:473 length:336 start_codon:yes stop_codon:yes gene_type:complete
MNHTPFDLNINNYSINEIKLLIKLPDFYNIDIIEESILNISKKILNLNLSKNENMEYISFLNNIKIILKNDLDKKENETLKISIGELKNTQEMLKRELNIMRKINEKIKTE